MSIHTCDDGDMGSTLGVGGGVFMTGIVTSCVCDIEGRQVRVSVMSGNEGITRSEHTPEAMRRATRRLFFRMFFSHPHWERSPRSRGGLPSREALRPSERGRAKRDGLCIRRGFVEKPPGS